MEQCPEMAEYMISIYEKHGLEDNTKLFGG